MRGKVAWLRGLAIGLGCLAAVLFLAGGGAKPQVFRPLALVVAGVAVLLWRASTVVLSGVDSDGDVVILRRPGGRLLASWAQVERVWLTRVRERRWPFGTDYRAQFELNDGQQHYWFSVPLLVAPYLKPLGFVLRIAQSSGDPVYALFAMCRARGVDVCESESDMNDTDRALFYTWASLYDVVQREPHRYGGVHQGPGSSGVLQVVSGQTDLRPGRHVGANVADAVGLPARDLMADVIVVECQFSRARLVEIKRELVRIQRSNPDSGIGRVEIADRDNVVEVELTGRKTVLTVAAFERFGGAVRLVEPVPTGSGDPVTGSDHQLSKPIPSRFDVRGTARSAEVAFGNRTRDPRIAHRDTGLRQNARKQSSMRRLTILSYSVLGVGFLLCAIQVVFFPLGGRLFFPAWITFGVGAFMLRRRNQLRNRAG